MNSELPHVVTDESCDGGSKGGDGIKEKQSHIHEHGLGCVLN